MALKDWKRITNENILIVYENIKQSKKQILIGSPDEKRWIVSVYIRSELIKTIKNFDTKSQALAFAKKYMRTH